MKGIILLLLAVLLMPSQTFSATSEDLKVYVRKDVFEVYMQNIDVKFERILDELKSQRQEITSQRQAITDLQQNVSVLSERIDGLDARLSARIDGLDARIGDLRNDIYLGLVVFGIIVSLPIVQKMLQTREKTTSNPTSAITLEDVKRLIEENNIKLKQNFTA